MVDLTGPHILLMAPGHEGFGKVRPPEGKPLTGATTLDLVRENR
jgi:hypothetical protein